MARPRVKINWEEFDKLCSIQCTLLEIASWFGCSPDTIERACKREHRMGFADYFAQKAAKGKISLRRMQWQIAIGGDRTMLIWLGKQYLEQSERMDQRQQITGKDGQPLVAISIPDNGFSAKDSD